MLTWAIYFLAENADVQQKAREEVAQVVGAAGEISHEHFEQLGSVKDVSDTNRIANNYNMVITLNYWYRTKYDEQTLGYNRSFVSWVNFH